MALVSDMWVLDLNCKGEDDVVSLNNVLILLAGIQDIRLNASMLVPSSEKNLYLKADGCLAINQKGEGRFLNVSDIDQCRKKYMSLSNR